jgi:alkylation response protein AidB-like acyl-CoA dehydrogenase
MTNVPGAFTDEQQELRSLAKRFLDENSESAQVRSLMETESGFDETLWKQMAELGWMGIAIPEEHGGAGYTATELAVLLEEMGRALLVAPFLSSVVFGSAAIMNAASDQQKKQILPGIADGTIRPTLAYTEPSGRWDEAGVTLQAEAGDEGHRLNGTKMYVLDGHTATHLVVVGRVDGELAFFWVDGDAEGITKKPLVTLDMTRKQSKLDFSNTPATKLDGTSDSSAALARTLQLGLVGMAAEMAGGAEWCLDTATEYAKTRIQFGRPIGAFQGVKHKCAEMLIQVEMARSAAYYAAWAAAEDETELPVAASLAKAYCGEAFFNTAAGAIQVLGGIGFTWEHDVHLYIRRAKSSEIYLGDADFHRDQVARYTGIDEGSRS